MVDVTRYDGSVSSWASLLGAAKTGYFGIKKQSYRSIAWRVFLGVLPGNKTCKDWKDDIEESRRRYEIIRAEHIPDFSKSVSDPLSPFVSSGEGGGNSEDGVWASYYQMSELRAEIQRDLDRLFIDGTPEKYFMDANRQQMMRTVLYIWSRMHQPLPSYRQGMHELLAYFLFVCETDTALVQGKMKNFVNCDDVEKQSLTMMENLTNSEHLEADIFCLFESLMEDMLPWFKVNEPPNRSAGFQTSDVLNKQQPVLIACDRVQGSNLQRVDPTLAKHLNSIEFSPQLYGLRWLRLLFGREFPLNDTVLIWDALFAVSAYSKQCSDTPTYVSAASSGPSGVEHVLGSEKVRFVLSEQYEKSIDKSSLVSFAEFVATSMIRSVREQIMEDDGPNGAMMALMKYKPPCAPAMIIARGLEMLRMQHSDIVQHQEGIVTVSNNGMDTDLPANSQSDQSAEQGGSNAATQEANTKSSSLSPLLSPSSSNMAVPSWLMSNVASAASQVSTKVDMLRSRGKSQANEQAATQGAIGTPYNFQHQVGLKSKAAGKGGGVVLVSPSAVTVVEDDDDDEVLLTKEETNKPSLETSSNKLGDDELVKLADHIQVALTTLATAWANTSSSRGTTNVAAPSNVPLKHESSEWYGSESFDENDASNSSGSNSTYSATMQLKSMNHTTDKPSNSSDSKSTLTAKSTISGEPLDSTRASKHQATSFVVGDEVRIRDVSVEEAKRIQEGHGGLARSMIDMLGEYGKVEAIWANGAEVTVGGRSWSKDMIQKVGNEEINEGNSKIASTSASDGVAVVYDDMSAVRAALSDLAEVEGILRSQVKFNSVKWQLITPSPHSMDGQEDKGGASSLFQSGEDRESLFVSSSEERGSLLSSLPSSGDVEVNGASASGSSGVAAAAASDISLSVDTLFTTQPSLDPTVNGLSALGGGGGGGGGDSVNDRPSQVEEYDFGVQQEYDGSATVSSVVVQEDDDALKKVAKEIALYSNEIEQEGKNLDMFSNNDLKVESETNKEPKRRTTLEDGFEIAMCTSGNTSAREGSENAASPGGLLHKLSSQSSIGSQSAMSALLDMDTDVKKKNLDDLFG